MNQQGYIVEIIDEKTAKLKLQRHSACAACGKCQTTSEKKDIVVEVDNTLGAKVGDHVEVNMENVNVLKAAGIVYVIPLIALLAGTISAYFILQALNIISNIEMMSGVVGLILTAVVFLVIKQNDKRFRDSRNYIPVVTKIIIL